MGSKNGRFQMLSENKTSAFASLVLGVTSFLVGICLSFMAWGQECTAVHNVEITYVFGPGDVYLRPGECVRFVNLHMIEHSAVGLEREFNSGVLMPGSTATLRFDEPMVIPFTCGVHPPMVGVIIVEPRDSNESVGMQDRRENLIVASSEGDPVAGKKIFNKCKVCHLLEEGGINRIGPNLFGIIGRVSGTLSDFKYSKAMRKAGITWDRDSLANYLVKPKNYIPGTKMAFPGLDTEKEIQDVVAYITEQTK